jgi:hypothetical protein
MPYPANQPGAIHPKIQTVSTLMTKLFMNNGTQTNSTVEWNVPGYTLYRGVARVDPQPDQVKIQQRPRLSAVGGVRGDVNIMASLNSTIFCHS